MYRNNVIGNPVNPQDVQHQQYVAIARTVVQVTLDEIEELLELLEDIEAETETVIDDLVTGIETPLDIMSITS